MRAKRPATIIRKRLKTVVKKEWDWGSYEPAVKGSDKLSIRLATHVFGIALALLPIGLLATIFTKNGAWFAGALIIAIETVLLSIIFTVYKTKIKK